MAFLDETGLAHFWNQILARLNKFVPAETGKGLSTNDYTTEEKTKLAGIEAGANKITVDSALSSTSTNPVQNNTINTKFDSIQTGIDNKVPNTRTVNGKALSGDITLSASDVGAVSYDTVQTLTDAQKAQARENIDSDNIYMVQLEYDGNNYILSANTPYADMKAAYEANKTLYCRVFMNNGNLILPLIRYEPSNDWWLFGIIATNQSYTIGITSDRIIGISADLVTTADLPTISTTLSSSSTDSEVPSAKCVYDELQKRNLKQATSDTLGGVKADPATESDTQPVRIGNDGKLVTAAGKPDISLGLTSASVGQTIKVKAVDESGKPTAWEAANMPSGGSSDGGLSADEKTLLLTLLKNAKYAENVQPAYEQLEALFNGGAIVTYTVTNNLTDLTTDNEAATITAGFPYKATLADADGNKPKSVEVVMGGVDVSGEYYADGVIDIPSVSGELVITAFAKNTYPVIYNLANTPVTCNADLYEDTGLAFGSESADGYTKSWTMVVKVKNVSAGYLWCVNGQKALSAYYENRWNSDAGDKVMTINTYICNTRVSSGITQANPDEVCIVITKEALSQKTATVHYLSWAGEYVADTVTGIYGQFFNSVYAANMMIGGQTGADFVGTIEEFVIYEGIMQEDEIKVVLGV